MLKKNILLEVVLLILLSLIPIFWFQNENVIIGHDSGFRPDGVSHLENLYYSWMDISNFGYDWSIFKGFLIIQAPEALFTFLLGSLHYGQIATSIFWFFVIAVSMYIFVYSFFPEKKYWIFRLFSSTLFSLNFFLLQGWFIVERAKFSLYAALPLGILVLYKTLRGEYSFLKGIIFFSLLSFFLNGGGFPSLFGGLIFSMFITFVYVCTVEVCKKGWSRLWYCIGVGFAFCIVFFLVNAYWILPQFHLATSTYSTALSSQGGIEGILAWEEVVSRFASISNLLRLQGIPDWYENSAHTYANTFIRNPFLILLSYFPFLIILAGFVHFKKVSHKSIHLLFLVTIIFTIGIIFTAGSHPPFGDIYILFVKYIPGFAIFRSALYKFGPMLWFSTAFLAGYFINILINKYLYSKRARFILGIAILASTIGYHFPFFNNKFFTWNSPFSTQTVLPSYTTEMAEYIHKTTGVTTRILLLPPLHPYYKSDSYAWGFWSLLPLPDTLFNRSVISNSSIAEQTTTEDIYKTLNIDPITLFERYAQVVGIEKILWRDDVLQINKKTTSRDLDYYKKNMQKVKNISLEKKLGEWELYAVGSNSSLFFTPNNTVRSRSDISLLEFLLVNEASNSSLIYSPSENGANSSQLIKATCVLCNDGEMSRMQNEVELPNIRFLRGSLFYPIQKIKENRIISNQTSKNSPSSKIDLNLILASNRVAEMILYYKSEPSVRSKFILDDIINEYKSYVNESVKESEKLDPIARNSYQIRLLAFLKAHEHHLLINARLFDRDVFISTHKFVSSTIKELEGSSWRTTDSRNKKYIVDIPKSKEFSVKLYPYTLASEIFIDGKSVENKEQAFLSEGVHRVEVRNTEVKNLLSAEDASTKIVELNTGESKIFKINDFDPTKKYNINFAYRKTKGKLSPSLSILHYKSNPKELLVQTNHSLNSNDIWNNFSYTVNPEPGATELTIRLSYSDPLDDISIIEFNNFTIHIDEPNLLFLKTIDKAENKVPPGVSFTQVNKTKYLVKIDDAQSPFLLVFNQNYNLGWKASYVNSSNTDSSTKTGMEQYRVNGFANGWWIDKNGSYYIEVEYTPQRYVYIGIVISIFALTIVLVLTIFNLMRRNGKKK